MYTKFGIFVQSYKRGDSVLCMLSVLLSVNLNLYATKENVSRILIIYSKAFMNKYNVHKQCIAKLIYRTW